MSENILTLIERRSKTDLLILVGLCVGTLLFMWVMYAYVKPALSLSFLVSSSSEPAVISNSTLANSTNDTIALE